MTQQSNNKSTTAVITTVDMDSLEVGKLYKIKTIPNNTNSYVFPGEKIAHQKMQNKYYQYWYGDDISHVFREYPYTITTFARDMSKEVHVHKKKWKGMTFTDHYLVRQQAKERYMIRKIYEKITNESGQLGTGPLDIIREMLGK